MEILEKIERNKLRGFLTARNKIIYPEAIYHLTQRAPGTEKLFLEKGDYLYMLYLLKDISSAFKWKIFSFALLPNHLHLLLQIKEANLSKGAKKLFERYAKYFNSKYERKGPVFCKPYRASLCLDETYLLAISLYIHLNPFKAGLVENPSTYKWSSIKLFTKEDSPPSFVEYKSILSLLNEDINRAKNFYRELLTQSNKVEYTNIVETPYSMRKFKAFVSNILSALKIKNKNGKQAWRLDQEILEFQKKKHSRSPEEIKAKKYLIEQLLSSGYKITEISSLLGISRQAIYYTLNLT